MSAFPEGAVDKVTQSRRLAILRVLRENEGAANESLLRAFLHGLGFRGRLVTGEALHGDGVYMEQVGFVRILHHHGGDSVVRTLEITAAGKAFLRRQAEPVPGIEFPDVG